MSARARHFISHLPRAAALRFALVLVLVWCGPAHAQRGYAGESIVVLYDLAMSGDMRAAFELGQRYALAARVDIVVANTSTGERR